MEFVVELCARHGTMMRPCIFTNLVDASFMWNSFVVFDRSCVFAILVCRSQMFLLPLGRTNTEYYTLNPQYGSNLNAPVSKKVLADYYFICVHAASHLCTLVQCNVAAVDVPFVSKVCCVALLSILPCCVSFLFYSVC